MSIQIAKEEFRLRAKAVRKGISVEQRAEAAQRVTLMFDQYCIDQTFGCVAGYLAIGSELDPMPLMKSLVSKGVRLTLPAVIADAMPLVFRHYQIGDALISEKFGTQAPSPEAKEYIPDIVLVPMLGFSAQGYRMGYGGGFYDRTIHKFHQAALPTRFIGLALNEQQFDALPLEATDQPLDGILTPQGMVTPKEVA